MEREWKAQMIREPSANGGAPDENDRCRRVPDPVSVVPA